MKTLSIVTSIALFAAAPAYAAMTSDMSAAKGDNSAEEAATHTARDPAVSNLSTQDAAPATNSLHIETTNMGTGSLAPSGTNIDSLFPKSTAMSNAPHDAGCNSMTPSSDVHAGSSFMASAAAPSGLPKDCSDAASYSSSKTNMRNSPTALITPSTDSGSGSSGDPVYSY